MWLFLFYILSRNRVFFLLRREFRRFPFTKTEHDVIMTETTMQGEKKKIDEKQTRDRKNVITILLMLAIATTGTENSFISTIKRDYDVVDVV